MTLLEWYWQGCPGRFVKTHWELTLEDGHFALYTIGYKAIRREVIEFEKIEIGKRSFSTLRDVARSIGQRPSQVHGEVEV